MKIIAIIISMTLIFFDSANAATIPSTKSSAGEPAVITLSHEMAGYISNLKIKEIEKLMGRKLKLKEKIGLKIYQWKAKKEASHKKIDVEKDKGKNSRMLGIFALGALLLSPFLIFTWMAAIPLAIIAIITGNKALKEDKNDKAAKTGVILGWITLGLMVIGTIFIIAVLAAIFGSWG
jgi:hypothetical protein